MKNLLLAIQGKLRSLPLPLRSGLIAWYDPWKQIEGKNILPTLSANLGTWTKSSDTTVTSGQSDFWGGSTAYRIVSSGSDKYYGVVRGIEVSAELGLHFSIYVKNNLETAPIVTIGSIGVAKSMDAGEGWEKYYLASTENKIGNSIEIVKPGWSAANPLDLYICGPQLTFLKESPYAPPTGFPQTLTDHSGNENHGILGASTSVASDDPYWLGLALKLDGVNDIIIHPVAEQALWAIGTTGNTFSWAPSLPAADAGSASFVYMGFLYSRVLSLTEEARIKKYGERVLASLGVTCAV